MALSRVFAPCLIPVNLPIILPMQMIMGETLKILCATSRPFPIHCWSVSLIFGLYSAVVSSFEKQHHLPLQFLFLLSIVGPHRPTPVIIRYPSWSCSSASSRLPATGPGLLHCQIKGSPLTMSNCHFSDLTFYNLSRSCFFYFCLIGVRFDSWVTALPENEIRIKAEENLRLW